MTGGACLVVLVVSGTVVVLAPVVLVALGALLLLVLKVPRPRVLDSGVICTACAFLRARASDGVTLSQSLSDAAMGGFKPLEMQIEEQRQKMKAEGQVGTPVTAESLAAWKERKAQKAERWRNGGKPAGRVPGGAAVDVDAFMNLMRTEWMETWNPRGRKLTTRFRIIHFFIIAMLCHERAVAMSIEIIGKYLKCS